MVRKLAMASSAARFGMHVEGLFEFFPEILGRENRRVARVFRHVFVAVVEVENFLKRAQMLLGSAVAIKAPAHRVRLSLIDDFHLIHVAVAALAGNTAIQVSGVIEVDVVG